MALQPKPNYDAEELLRSYRAGTPEEKALLRKIDSRLLPAVFLMYVLSYLDRANIGNAKTGGMEKEYSMSSNAYSIVLTIFFVGYVLGEVPSNMILTRVRPSVYLPTLMFLWGAVSVAFAATHNWQEVAIIRFVIGLIESGFAPGVAFLLSSWYRKSELGSRFAIYYSATAVSGAFGGLIAGSVIGAMEGVGGLSGWRWLFIVEGLGTVAGCVAAFFILPDYPSNTSWLTEGERKLATARLLADSIGQAAGPGATHGHVASLVETLGDWRTWMFTLLFMLVTGSQTIQYFIPTLMTQLGYSGNTAQYMTVPPYTVAAVAILSLGLFTDKTGDRALVIAGCTFVATISFVVDVVSYDDHVRYAFLCLAVAGVWTSCMLTLVFLSNVIVWPSEKRAVAQAFVNAMGNSASIYGSFLWPDSTKPRYVQGFSTTIAFLSTACFTSLVLRSLNKKYPYVIPDAEAVFVEVSAEKPAIKA
ncbi:major facilitator superfamily domain-containing protein [Zopfochytrium polystomum]|nr:major facilitator superfamily domain-containing protein [Zopfochytrium polystomum]